MRYRVRHRTLYRYAEPVDLSAQMLHLLPRELEGQRVVSARLVAVPEPERLVRGEDHFGNLVCWMFLGRPHDRFELTLDAEVEVGFAPPPDATPGWEHVVRLAAAGGPGAWRAAEFAFASAMAPADAGAGAYAAASFPAGQPVLEGLRDFTRRINRDFAFRPGETDIDTPVARVLARREGVCQDFAHLMIAGLRALGLPARYVSGYLRTTPPRGRARLRGADQSHAWVEGWLGPEHGWVGLDPTNDLVVRDDHVVLGWGRDYRDVSPVRGVILGGGAHRVEVGVDLVPV